MAKIKHLNDKYFDMAMGSLADALETNKPTEKDECIELAIRLLKRPDVIESPKP